EPSAFDKGNTKYIHEIFVHPQAANQRLHFRTLALPHDVDRAIYQIAWHIRYHGEPRGRRIPLEFRSKGSVFRPEVTGHARVHEVLLVKAKISFLDVLQLVVYNSRAHQQYNGNRELRHHQRIAKRTARRPCAEIAL